MKIIKKKEDRKVPKFSVGDVVQVRAKEEIQKSLDADSKIDGCLLMNQMWKYCGQNFRVKKVVGAIFDEYRNKMSKTHSPLYILDGMLCDGQTEVFDHRCDRSCYLLWSEEWIKEPADPATSAPSPFNEESHKSIMSCQLIDIDGVVKKNSSWENLYQFSIRIFKQNVKKFLRALKSLKSQAGKSKRRTKNKLDSKKKAISPGDTVRVKSSDEIRAMLNPWGRYKGCRFMREMHEHCDKEYKVLKKIDYFFDESRQKMYRAKNTVILEGAICGGGLKLYPITCDRSCYFFWRTEWLEKMR